VEIKICGLCRPEDAAWAAEAGADYLGVVLAPGGRRSRSLEEAASIFGAAPDARRVGVFVDAGVDEVVAAARRLGLAVVQLHGGEAPRVAAELRAAGGWQVWKAIRPRDRSEFLAGVEAYGAVVDAILVDGWSAAAPGGTGARFPWDEVAAARSSVPPGLRLFVAGGLDPANVAEAVARLAPDGVDVSSGVEAVVGEKAPEKVRAFIAAARKAAGSPGGPAAPMSL
jgi:phosphoribosylanthranilate isomerase